MALNNDGGLAANAQTTAGCSLMNWENTNGGRQRWCIRLVQGGGFAGPLFDGFANLYVGQPGTILAYPLTQWVRWRKQVIGMRKPHASSATVICWWPPTSARCRCSTHTAAPWRATPWTW